MDSIPRNNLLEYSWQFVQFWYY